MKINIDYKFHVDNFEKIKGKGVYLIQNHDNNRVKIGITDNLSRRFKEILKGFRFCGTIPNLEIISFIEYKDNLKLEQYLHKELKEYNYLNEWFDFGDNPQPILDALDKFKQKPITYQYYKYVANDCNGEIKEFYIDCSTNRHSSKNQACWILDEIYMSIFKKDSCFLKDVDTYCTPINPSEYLIKSFEKLNTVAIAKISDNYISLEDYFMKIYNKNLLDSLANIKECVNDSFDELLDKNNIETSISNKNLENKIRDIIEIVKSVQEDFQV